MLSPKEAAAFVGVHPRTLARWFQDGKIPGVLTPGGHRRYPLNALLKLRVYTSPAPSTAQARFPAQ